MTSKFEETFPKWITAHKLKLPLVTVLTEKHSTRVKVHNTYDELVEYCFQVVSERFAEGCYDTGYTEQPTVAELFEKKHGFPLSLAEALMTYSNGEGYFTILNSVEVAIFNNKHAVTYMAEDIKFYGEVSKVIDGSVDKVYAVKILLDRPERFKIESYRDEICL